MVERSQEYEEGEEKKREDMYELVERLEDEVDRLNQEVML